MKKLAIFLLAIIAVVATISYIYLNYSSNLKIVQKENANFEIYKDKEIPGTELATIINKTIDTNQKNGILKDKKGKYIENESNSINIDIKFIDDDVVYNIEKIYNNGIQKFVNYYRDITFICSDIEYHNSTGKIKYMKFEQITQ